MYTLDYSARPMINQPANSSIRMVLCRSMDNNNNRVFAERLISMG